MYLVHEGLSVILSILSFILASYQSRSLKLSVYPSMGLSIFFLSRSVPIISYPNQSIGVSVLDLLEPIYWSTSLSILSFYRSADLPVQWSTDLSVKSSTDQLGLLILSTGLLVYQLTTIYFLEVNIFTSTCNTAGLTSLFSISLSS